MQRLSTHNKKLVLTNKMIESFPKDSQLDLRTALIKWWINSRKTGGLRLTSNGYKIISEMRYNSYLFNASKLTTSNNLLIMDKNFECPYYIDGLGRKESKLYVFGDREATMINLYGDVNSFLKSFH